MLKYMIALSHAKKVTPGETYLWGGKQYDFGLELFKEFMTTHLRTSTVYADKSEVMEISRVEYDALQYDKKYNNGAKQMEMVHSIYERRTSKKYVMATYTANNLESGWFYIWDGEFVDGMMNLYEEFTNDSSWYASPEEVIVISKVEYDAKCDDISENESCGLEYIEVAILDRLQDVNANDSLLEENERLKKENELLRKENDALNNLSNYRLDLMKQKEKERDAIAKLL